MSKKRKTRQQKMITVLRRKASSSPSPKTEMSSSHPTESLQSYNYLISGTPPTTTPTSQYSFDIRDIRRTTILVAFLICAELVLFFLLKGKVLTIPMLTY